MEGECTQLSGVGYKLLFNCESLEKISSSPEEHELLELSLTKYQLTGEVVFKGEYLLILKCHIRIGLVLNNKFRHGNHVYMGNNEIDHTDINLGDTLKITGKFILSPIHFCVFTLKRSEMELPIVDYKWTSSKFYKYVKDIEEDVFSLDIESLDPLKFVEIEELIYDHNQADDLNIVELDLVSLTPVEIDQKRVGISGYYRSINWIEPKKMIKNCGGRIIQGVKVEEWFYYDKTGNNKIEINYGKK